LIRARTVSPSALSSQASVTAVGRPAATSCAKVGPDSTAIGEVGQTSCATSCSSLPLRSSMPFEQRISGMSGARRAAEHRPHMLRRGHHQPGVRFGKVEKLLVARIAVPASALQIDRVFVAAR
jgi:hypothetical protein